MIAYLLLAAVFPAMILGFPVQGCGGGAPTPSAIRIVGCPTSPCNIDRGGVIPFEVDFTASAAASTMTVSLYSTVFGETNLFPLPPAMVEGCNGLIAGSCPVAAGAALTFAAVIPVDTELHDGVAIALRFDIAIGGSSTVCAIVNAVVH